MKLSSSNITPCILARTTTAFLTAYASLGVLYKYDRLLVQQLYQQPPVHMLIDLEALVLKYFNSFSLLVTLDEAFKGYHCSMLAAAIVLHTRRILNIVPTWNPELIAITSYEAIDIVRLADKIFQKSKALQGAKSKVTDNLSEAELNSMFEYQSSGPTLEDEALHVGVGGDSVAMESCPVGEDRHTTHLLNSPEPVSQSSHMNYKSSMDKENVNPLTCRLSPASVAAYEDL